MVELLASHPWSIWQSVDNKTYLEDKKNVQGTWKYASVTERSRPGGRGSLPRSCSGSNDLWGCSVDTIQEVAIAFRDLTPTSCRKETHAWMWCMVESECGGGIGMVDMRTGHVWPLPLTGCTDLWKWGFWMVLCDHKGNGERAKPRLVVCS